MIEICIFSFVICGSTGQITDFTPDTVELFDKIKTQLSNFTVILKPDKLEPEWWAGAPSVVRDNNGIFYLACRMRAGEGKRGFRGYEIRILKSEDGVCFKKVKSIKREEVPVLGFERPSILLDPFSGKFKLYACAPDENGIWSVIKFDDVDNPEDFVPSSAKKVIQPPSKRYERDILPRSYKDPVIFFDGKKFHCYVIGYIRENEWIFHFISANGEEWEPCGEYTESIMSLSGWHNFFVRPASVLPVGVGYLFIYEGSNAKWYDPVYNIATGLGFTYDLHKIIDLTPDKPLLVSSTPNRYFFTFRYSQWLWVGDEVWIYAEVACPDMTNEIRLFKLKLR